jgi:AICAR transformylase/IMP cyclohydrolase PurH
MSGRLPPRYVPTLTEVVNAPAAGAEATSAFTQEQLVHRIMQRIDLSLERRLREAIATTVLEQTRLLGPLLREEIEIVVRQTVSQALAEELNAAARPARPA